MDQFTNINVLVLRKDIEEALKGVSKKHDITIQVSGIRYSPTECTTKITAVCAKGNDGELLQSFEKDYLDRQRIDPEMKNLGEKFTANHKTFTICGWKPKNRKYPLLAKSEMDVTYKFPKRYAY